MVGVGTIKSGLLFLFSLSFPSFIWIAAARIETDSRSAFILNGFLLAEFLFTSLVVLVSWHLLRNRRKVSMSDGLAIEPHCTHSVSLTKLKMLRQISAISILGQCAFMEFIIFMYFCSLNDAADFLWPAAGALLFLCAFIFPIWVAKDLFLQRIAQLGSTVWYLIANYAGHGFIWIWYSGYSSGGTDLSTFALPLGMCLILPSWVLLAFLAFEFTSLENLCSVQISS